MNIGVHVSLSDLVSSVCMPRSGIAGRDIKANTLLSFEKDHSLHFGINSLTQLLFKFFLNGEIQEKSPNLKNGFPDSGPDSNSKEVAGEEDKGAFSNFPISEETTKLLKKDISFAIPLVEKLLGELQDRKRGHAPQVLVLAPTRELASQVSRDFSDITKKLAVACFYGGTPYRGQIEHMKNGIDILVGTPGRIKDHLQNGKLDLTKLKHVVLDEVDQMLHMGFADQVEEILCVAYKKDSEDNPQILFFSAICPYWVFNVAKKYMKSTYEQVDLIGKKTQKRAITVEHLAIKCHWTQRAAVIGDVIQVYSGFQGRTIIFCEMKKEAQELSENVAVRQDAQEITLKGFRNGDFGVLVATNVSAHELDIPEVDLVVQSSPPKDVESYIHLQVEQKAGIKFKRIGVPSATEIIKASKDAIRLLHSVPPTAICHFKQTAEKLTEEKGAVGALAAALAISGATVVDQCSFINSEVGFVTMILHCSIEMPNITPIFTSDTASQLENQHGLIFQRGHIATQKDFSGHCGGKIGSKNQNNLTKIECLVTQTLRQLTHMVPYFKHEETDTVLTAWCC
ncbi:hypothetical protein FD755_014048 [Muntiacus reevesi]|uniref:RNA helicase n=1 Tax=Muntiacus reevesi TaxID=9886 RepID=A0A5N3XII9_MUNRE|nr:hypothetical protein FD755_014048 [Muntiacus reevesi]